LLIENGGACEAREHQIDHFRAIEAGIELKLATPQELAELILAGEFVLQLHLGAVLLTGMRGHLNLGASR